MSSLLWNEPFSLLATLHDLRRKATQTNYHMWGQNTGKLHLIRGHCSITFTSVDCHYQGLRIVEVQYNCRASTTRMTHVINKFLTKDSARRKHILKLWVKTAITLFNELWRQNNKIIKSRIICSPRIKIDYAYRKIAYRIYCYVAIGASLSFALNSPIWSYVNHRGIYVYKP